jgi:hypothetical protein
MVLAAKIWRSKDLRAVFSTKSASPASCASTAPLSALSHGTVTGWQCWEEEVLSRIALRDIAGF